MNILDEIVNGDIYIRHAVDETPNEKDFNMHVHDRCEIFYFISGNAEYLVEGSVYPLESGSLMIMRPGEAHCIKILNSERYERYAINFPLWVFDSFDPERRLMKPFTDRPLGKENIFAIHSLDDVFKSMCEKISDNYAIRLVIMTKLIMLTDIINSEYKRRTAVDDKPLTMAERIVSYVNRHLTDRLSVPAIAEHFFLSPSQFSRIFKQATGAPPWEYITAKRLTAAKEKIRRGVSAQNAAESCGFGDYSAFYRAYVKRFGGSPNKAE